MTTYYVSTTTATPAGSDSNNGTAEATPWATLAKVKSTTFTAGDTVLFKRGETWRGHLSLVTGKSGITIDAYGTGAKPLILGSTSRKLTGDWVAYEYPNTTVEVSASDDDADNQGATFSYTGVQVRAGYNSAVQTAGFRWQNVTIPAGSTILSAYFSVELIYGSSGALTTRIYGEDADSPGAWATTTHEPSGITKTTAYVDWDASFVAGIATSPDLKTVIQEIVDRVGWASGNSLALTWAGSGVINRFVTIRAWDNTHVGARLFIEYNPPGWTPVSNIWRTTATIANDDFGNDVGIISFNGDTAFGFKRFYLSGTVTDSGNTTTLVNVGTVGGTISSAWVNHVIRFTAGVNSGLSRTITAYNGSTKIATVSPALPDACDGTSTYILSDITQQGDFYTPWHWPPTTPDYLYMYSVGNPATYYTDIELGMRQSVALLTISGQTDLTIRNLEFKYGGRHGCSVYGTASVPANRVILEYLDFSYGGGCRESSTNTSERSGSAIQPYSSAQNITIRYCTFDNWFETGVDFQIYSNNQTMGPIWFHHNMVTCTTKGIEYAVKSSTTGNTVTGIVIAHNVFYNMGGGWMHSPPNQRTSEQTNFTGMIIWNSGGTVTDSHMSNNIFHTMSGSDGYYVYAQPYDDLSGFTPNYNCYYGNTQGWKLGTTVYGTIGAWRTASGQDANSIVADPLFDNAATYDFHIGTSSPCRDTGMVLARVGQVVIGAAPDIGLYELPLPGFFKLCPFRMPRWGSRARHLAWSSSTASVRIHRPTTTSRTPKPYRWTPATLR